MKYLLIAKLAINIYFIKQIINQEINFPYKLLQILVFESKIENQVLI